MMKKTTRNQTRIVTTTTIVLVIVMMAATIFGMIFFQNQLSKTGQSLEDEEYKVYEKYYVMITSNDKSDFWQEVYQGANKAGEQSDAYVDMYIDGSAQYSMSERMQIAIASGVDGIIVEGEDSRKMKEMAALAESKNIPIVTVNQDIQDSSRISYVGMSNYELGQAYGAQVCDLASDILNERDQNIKVLVLMSDGVDSSRQNLLLSGIKEDVAAKRRLEGKITIETYTVDDSGSFSAEESIRDLFIGQEEYPDIIVCLSETHTTCTYQAVVDYNKVGEVNIIGYYDSDTILNAIDKEIIYSSISLNAEQMGQYSVKTLNEYLETGYTSDYFAVDDYLINQDNIAEYTGGK